MIKVTTSVSFDAICIWMITLICDMGCIGLERLPQHLLQSVTQQNVI